MNKKAKIFLLASWLFFQSFSCLSRGWRLPVIDISDDTQNAFEPQIAINDSGDALHVIWLRSDGSNDIAQARRYGTATTIWLPVVNLSAAGQHAFEPQVAMDSAGNAVAIWHRSDGSNLIVQTSKYDEATDTWSAVTDLSDAGQDAASPQVAMDTPGNATAVWQRSDGTHEIIQTKRYDEATDTWSAVANLSAAGQNASRPQVVMDSTGNATAVWQRSDGSNLIVQTSRYDEATDTWSAVTDLSDAGQNALKPQVAMDAARNAVVVWIRFDGSSWIVQTRRYDEATDTWSPVIDLSDAGQHAEDAEVAMNAVGNATAVWRRSNGSEYIVQTKRYDKATNTWSAVTELSAAGHDAIYTQVAMNTAGNTVAVWILHDGSNWIVQTKRYYKTTDTWSTVTDLSAAEQDAAYPRVAMDPAGNTIAAWGRNDDITGQRVIQAALFNAQLPAPSNLSACKKIHRFPAQIDLIHCLAWDTVENATKYRVYLDTSILAAEPAVSTNPSTELHGRCPCTSYTYEVVAVDPEGDNGLPASVTI